MPPKAGKKGLSLEEKRTKLLEFFTKEHMFYNIKEVEALGGKYVGVHPMQMKELLQTLLDDNLVNAEKCGVTTLYWCFEYDKHRKMEVLIKSKQDKLDQLERKKKGLISELETARKVRQRGDAAEMVSRIEQMTAIRDELKSRLASSAFGMDRVEEIKKQLMEMITNGQAATDNIEQLVYHFQKTAGISREYFHQELGVPLEFTDFEDLDKLFTNLEHN